jgi:hypothetical protein
MQALTWCAQTFGGNSAKGFQAEVITPNNTRSTRGCSRRSRSEMQEALALLPRSEADLIYLAFFKRMTYLAVANQLGLGHSDVPNP